MEIAATKQFFELHKIIASTTPTNNSLLGGKLGMALYYYSLYEAFYDLDYGEKSVVLLEEVLQEMSTETPDVAGTTFASGGAGLGYVVSAMHHGGLIEINLQEELAVLDKLLFTVAMEQITQRDAIDYLHGAMGVVHYFTQRLPDTTIEKYTLQILQALCNRAIEEPEGIWFQNYVIDEREKEQINLSLSHGLSGLIILLVNAQQKLPRQGFLYHTIAECVAFILAHYIDISSEQKDGAFFPSTIDRNQRDSRFYTPRLSWCYGDLNAVLALYTAGNLLERPEWTSRADELGSATFMRKSLDDVAARDTHFSHGTSGVAQFYQRFYEMTHKKIYESARDHWIEQTLNLLPSEMQKKFYAGKECDLLEGLVGVNLSLVSYISDRKLAWSKALLL